MAKLKLQIPEEKIRTSFKLKKSAADVLKNYSLYMSDSHKTAISQDAIMESLIDKLAKDKDFQKFCSNKEAMKMTSSKESDTQK